MPEDRITIRRTKTTTFGITRITSLVEAYRTGRRRGTRRRRLVTVCRYLYRWLSGTLLKDSEAEDGELSTVYCRPEGLDKLMQQTKFNRRELQILYREFKNDCPSGMMNEEAFKTIYSQFFPHGDSAMYAHFLFQAFDIQNNGAVSFEDFVTGLSVILRGSMTDRLNWAFNLYDLNKDGCITKEEMTGIMHSIYNMMGKHTYPSMKDNAPKDHVDNFFRKMDRNNDGVVTMEEFIETCKKDENIMQSMHMFDHVI